MSADTDVDMDVELQASIGSFHLDLRLSVARGPVAIVGPNGAGKTTVLRLLAGAIQPSQGHIRVRGRTLVDPNAFLAPEDRRVGYLPQGSALFEHLSAGQNVAYGIRDLPRAERSERASALLASVGGAHLAHRRPRGLSGGERQKVALARALARSPDLLLLDEPTASLDVLARPEIRSLLAPHLHNPGRCAVVVTHDLRDLLAWQPTVVLLEAGRVVTQGSVEALRDSEHPFLVELLAPLQPGGPPASLARPFAAQPR